jgi:two-component system, LuxR family, sensor histidine kinase DctS
VADTIEVTGHRIEKIVKSMRTMAHQQSDREPFERIMVSEIVEDALNWCQSRFLDHGVRLIKPELITKTRVECRSYQMVQVLVNLLNNSFDAVESSDDKWVQIEVKDGEDWVEISVTDSGKGIPEDVRKKIFDPFFSTKRVQYGTGLGLSISVGLVRQNKGELIYDNSSRNTRFIMRLRTRQNL